MNQGKKIVKIYKKKEVVKNFDKERNNYDFQRYKHKIESSFLKKAINSIKHGKIKVLDVACGTGRMLPEVFSVGKNMAYFGFDSSKEMAKHLKEKTKVLGLGKNVKVKIGNASRLPFKDSYFDIVYRFHLLWHLPKEDQEKIIKEMMRVCKKQGIVIFDALNKDFIWEKSKSLFGIKKNKGIYKLSVKEIKSVIGNHNFKIEKLNDFPVKKNLVYMIFNIFNHLRGFLPVSFYHMIYIKIKK